jgi:hypothetical protein
MEKPMKRPRKYIRTDERLAAALFFLIPDAEVRATMRDARLSARAVIRMFHFDHGELHALGGKDKWWNLWPMLVAAHKTKSRRDTSIVAKVRRIEKEPERWLDLTGPKRRGKPLMPRNKIRSRGFQKGQHRAWPKRKFRS